MLDEEASKIKQGDKLKVKEDCVFMKDAIIVAASDAILSKTAQKYYILVESKLTDCVIDGVLYGDRVSVNCKYVEFVVEELICTCDSRDLFYRGCKCGQWERQKNGN